MNTSSSDGAMARTIVGATAIEAKASSSCRRACVALRALEPDVQAVAEEVGAWRRLRAGHARGRVARVGDDHFEPLPGQRAAQPARLVEREHLALVQQGNAVAALGFIQVRRGHQDGDALLQELREQLPELAPRHGIDAGGRLVEDDDVGLVDERAGQRQLLLHAAGEPIREPLPERRQLGHVQQPVAAGVVVVDAVDLGEEGDVLVDAEIAVETESL